MLKYILYIFFIFLLIIVFEKTVPNDRRFKPKILYVVQNVLIFE